MIRVSAFRWVPAFAQGLARDLRVRWADPQRFRDFLNQGKIFSPRGQNAEEVYGID